MSDPNAEADRQLAPSDGVYTNKDGNRFKIAKGDPIPEGMTFEATGETGETGATGATGVTGPGQTAASPTDPPSTAADPGTRQTTASKAQQRPKDD